MPGLGARRTTPTVWSRPSVKSPELWSAALAWIDSRGGSNIVAAEGYAHSFRFAQR